MKNLETLVISFGEKIFFPECLGWVGSNKIFFWRKKTICFYLKTKEKCHPEKFDCFKKIKIASQISWFLLNLKEKILLAATCDGALFLRSFFSSKKSRVFFTNSHFFFFEKDPFQSGIFYTITKKKEIKKNSFSTDSLFSLEVFNVKEKKSVQIYKFRKKSVPQIFLCFSKKKKLLVTSECNYFLFFFFEWNSRKLFLRKKFHDSEILSICLFGDYILASDRNGYFIFFEQILQKRVNSGKKTISFLQKKTRLSLFGFSFLARLEKFFFLVNLKERDHIIHFGVGKISKKKISIVSEKENFLNVKKNHDTNELIGITNFNEIFIFKFFRKFSLQITRKLEIPLVFKRKYYKENFSTSCIKISHLNFVDGETFLIFGLGNFFYLLDLEKMDSINSSLANMKNFKICSRNHFRNYVKYNFLSNSIFFSYGGALFKVGLTSYNLLGFNFFSWENTIRKNQKANGTRKNVQIFSFLKDGKLVCLKISEFSLKIYDHSYSSGFWKYKKENFRFFRQKCISVDFSKDGFFLLTSCSNFLTLWKIYPILTKMKIVPFNVKGKLKETKFLSNCNQELILIYSSSEIKVWDFKNNQINFKVKLQIFGLEADDDGEKLLISTRYFWLSTFYNIPAIIIFKFNTSIPVAVFNSDIFYERCILALNFYKEKKKNRRSGKLILIDNFLELYKIVF